VSGRRAPAAFALAFAALLGLAGCDRFTSVETRLGRAAESLEAGEYQAALVDVRKALQSEPDNVEAMLLHVDVLAASGDVESARAQLDRALAAGAPPSAVEPRRIEVLIAAGDLPGASAALESSHTLAPAAAASFEGQLLLRRQQPAEAEAAFSRAIEAEPRLQSALIGRAEALAVMGRTDEALRVLAQVRQAEPASGRAWLLTGGIEAQLGNVDAAVAALREAVAKGRGMTMLQTLRAHSALISVLLASGRLEDAREALAGLESAAGGSALVPLMRARVALAAGDTSSAVNDLRGYVRDVPGDVTGRILLASALLEQGNAEQAYRHAVRAAADFPGEDAAQLALAEIQQRLGRTEQAEQTLAALATRPQPNPQALALLGRLRIQQGESLAGIDYLRRGLAERPEDIQLQLQLAAAYVAAGEPRRAAEVLDAIPEGQADASLERLRVIVAAALQGSEEAERQLEAAIQKHPEDLDLLRLAAAHYSGSGNLDLARRYLLQARKLRPEDVGLKLAHARLEIAGTRLDEAEALVRDVLSQSEAEVAAMMLMAEIEVRRGRDAEVDSWLERARTADAKALSPRFAMVRRAVARGDVARARALLDEAATVALDEASVQLALGELNVAAGRAAEARVHLKRAAELDPASPVILLAMARVDLAEGRVAGARQSLQRATEIAPDWLPAASTLVALETRQGNLGAALEVARRLRQRDPQGAASFILEGDAYLGASRPADAAAAYRVAYLRAPSAPLAARNAQAKSLAGIGNPEAELQDWLRNHPDDGLARRTLAEYLLAAGRKGEAVAELEVVIAARPEDPIALNNLAWLYDEAGDPRARALAAKAYELAPDNGAVADTYGWILARGGNAAEAERVLRRAVELAPGDAEIRYHLAVALNGAGKTGEALAELRTLLGSETRFASRAEAERLRDSLERR
jgi:putative PEP-CTERM system TPR-repeat lipoprotein